MPSPLPFSVRPRDGGGSRVFQAAEAGVIEAGIGRGLHARAGTITAAIRIITEIGTAPLHAFLGSGLVGIEAVIRTWWVFFRTRGVIIGKIPIQTPLPHVAGHVVEPVSVRPKGRHGSRSTKAI
jgi:hypothetical protein